MSGGDLVMTLNSGDEHTYPLEPGQSSVRSAFRQTLKVPLNLVEEDWEVALTSMIYPHTFGNAVLKESDEYHAIVRDKQGLVKQRIRLSPYVQYKTRRDVLTDLLHHFPLLKDESVAWEYDEVDRSGNVIVYPTAQSLYLSCYRGLITFHGHVLSTLKQLLPSRLVLPLSSPLTVGVQTRTGLHQLNLVTANELTAWVTREGNLPFTNAQVVDYLRGVAAARGYMDFSYESDRLQLVFLGAREIRTFRVSSGFALFVQYTGVRQVVVKPYARTVKTFAFDNRRPCLVAPLGSVVYWGLNGNTLRVSRQTKEGLLANISSSPHITVLSGVHIRYENQTTKEQIDLPLFRDDVMDDWLRMHGVMPTQRQSLILYLQMVRRGVWNEKQRGLLDVQAVNEINQIEMKLGRNGYFTFPSSFSFFTQYGGPLAVYTDEIHGHWTHTPVPEGMTVYAETDDSLRLCANRGGTLELYHGLPAVMGFDRLTDCARIQVDDRPLTTLEATADSKRGQHDLFVTLTWSSFLSGSRTVTFPSPSWNNALTSQQIVVGMMKELAVLPDFLAGPAVHFKNEVTGEEVDLDLFREDLLRRYLDADQVLLSGNDVAVYLNRAKNNLDDKARNAPIHFTSSHGGDHLELQLKGQCTYTLSPAMAEFIALETSPFSSRIITVQGNPSTSYSYDWNVYRSRYQDTSPVVVYQLGSEWFFLGVYGSMTPSPPLQSLLPTVAFQKGTYWTAPAVYDVQVGGGKRRMLGDTDLSHAYVELDLVEPSVVGGRWRSLLTTLALNPEHYGKTITLHFTQLDYRPLVAPLRHVSEVRVYIRNAEDVNLSFYTGLVTLTLHFRRRRKP